MSITAGLVLVETDSDFDLIHLESGTILATAGYMTVPPEIPYVEITREVEHEACRMAGLDGTGHDWPGWEVILPWVRNFLITNPHGQKSSWFAHQKGVQS